MVLIFLLENKDKLSKFLSMKSITQYKVQQTKCLVPQGLLKAQQVEEEFYQEWIDYLIEKISSMEKRPNTIMMNDWVFLSK